jgi:hypothetical protein
MNSIQQVNNTTWKASRSLGFLYHNLLSLSRDPYNITKTENLIKKHILASMNYFDSDMSKSTNMVVYFDLKTVIYIYVCGQCRSQFVLPNSSRR